MNENTEIICEFRTIATDGTPLCQVVADLNDFPLEICHTNDSACEYCLRSGVAPQAPNQVTASMSVHAAHRYGEANGGGTMRRMAPTLRAPATEEPTLENTPCVLRGMPTRQQACKPCQAGGKLAVMVPVYACTVHGECTLRNTGTLPKIQGCVTCQARQSQYAQIDATPLPTAVVDEIRKTKIIAKPFIDAPA
jgi:hypothetical protein